MKKPEPKQPPDALVEILLHPDVAESLMPLLIAGTGALQNHPVLRKPDTGEQWRDLLWAMSTLMVALDTGLMAAGRKSFLQPSYDPTEGVDFDNDEWMTTDLLW